MKKQTAPKILVILSSLKLNFLGVDFFLVAFRLVLFAIGVKSGFGVMRSQKYVIITYYENI